MANYKTRNREMSRLVPVRIQSEDHSDQHFQNTLGTIPNGVKKHLNMG